MEAIFECLIRNQKYFVGSENVSPEMRLSANSVFRENKSCFINISENEIDRNTQQMKEDLEN